MRKSAILNLPETSGKDYIHLKFNAGREAYTYAKVSLFDKENSNKLEEELVFLVHSVEPDRYFE